MADEPPRPKPGSLKDRIKQFEQSSTNSSSAPAPPPLRPKPGALGQWKPKAIDPPSPTKATTSSEPGAADDEHGPAGMSAADAASSIRTGGGSLKERMAALQGKGAFGSSAATTAPPLPSHEGKPRVWRTSPVPPIEPKAEGESGEKQEGTEEAQEPSVTSPVSPGTEQIPGTTEEAEGEAEPKTEEEEERERRAAIAARMARLGGARVGMPVGFGVAAKGLHNKPAPPVKPKILTPGGGNSGSAGTSPLPISPSTGEHDEGEEPVKKTTLDTALAIPLPKSQGSLLSPSGLDVPSDSDATTSGKLVPPRSPSIPKSPDSMPIPALPKRAAGPRRKKSGKDLKPSSSIESETVPTIPREQVQSPPTIETEQAKDAEYFPEEKITSEEPTSIGHKEVKEEPSDDLVSVPPSDNATPPPPSPSVGITEDEANEDSDVAQVPTKKPTLDISVTEDHEKTAEYHEAAHDTLTPKPKEDEEAEETEEERAARKKRVAEKMAQLGGVNPFSPGGFISPTSPSGQHVEEPESAQEATKDNDDIHEEGDSKHEEDAHEGDDKDVTESAHESKTIPVLSSSDDSQDHDRSAIVSTSIERAPTQGTYAYANQSAKATRVEGGDQDPALVEDDEVDYPMMSPSGDSRDVSFSAAHGGDVEVAPRGSGEVKRSPTHDEEEILSHEERESTPIQESAVPQELEYDYEPETPVTHENRDYIDQQEDEEDMRPPRITRAVPPPPSRRPPSIESSPASSTKNSPRNSQFADVNDASPPRAQLVAALARRAPVPPPHRSTSSSSSASPPSSPPATFEREGAPSPPSLRSLSNIEDEDEEEYVEEDSGVLGSEGASAAVLNDEARSSSPAPMRINRSGNASPAPASRSPPPIPSSRPPIPAVRRSIPPPPPESPPPRSRPASGRASPAPVHGRKPSIGDAAEGVAIRKAATRPAVPPPRWEEFDAPQSHEREIMDDEEGDPVDPAFVGNKRSPQPSGTSPPPLAPRPSSRTGSLVPQRQGSVKPEVTEEPPEALNPTEQEEDPETARRRTIAERMAKLGGIKFGMAPPIRAPPIRKATEPNEEADESKHPESEDVRIETAQGLDSEQTPEEVERSRRAAIAARMAAMGGRGFGIYGAGAVPAAPAIVNNTPSQPAAAAMPPRAPLAAPPPIPKSRPRINKKDDAIIDAVNRAPPPPLGPSVAKGGETSESEAELVNAEEEEGEMIEEEVDEPELVDTPQPPSRAARLSVHHTSRPPPPIPGQYVQPPDEEGGTALPPPAARRLPPTRAAPPPVSPPNEYVDLGEENLPPSLRPAHSRPPPAVPSDSGMPPSLDSSGQWELPNIPSGSFDLSGYSMGKQPPRTVEQDQSWTKVEQEDQPSTSAPTTSDPFTGPSPVPLSADRLAALARTLGPKVLQSAQHVYEKSKRLVIGDGSSISFLYIVLGPTGASTSSLGHLVYAQNGANVQKRLGDIMPGDVIALYEAHFKGHKGGLGLGGYSASWGTREEPVLGVVGEFDGKKSKVRAYAVNQHPNAYPTIDNPSFKLDDLKSGLVKVFRVAAES